MRFSSPSLCWYLFCFCKSTPCIVETMHVSKLCTFSPFKNRSIWQDYWDKVWSFFERLKVLLKMLCIILWPTSRLWMLWCCLLISKSGNTGFESKLHCKLDRGNLSVKIIYKNQAFRDKLSFHHESQGKKNSQYKNTNAQHLPWGYFSLR